MFYLNLCTSLILSIGQKKKLPQSVIVQCCVINTRDIIKLVLRFTWNNQFVISYQRREIARYSYEVELQILV